MKNYRLLPSASARRIVWAWHRIEVKSPHPHATQIIVIIHGNGRSVILAADSVVTDDLGEPSSKECKIKQSGGIFWAMDGLASDDKFGNFSAASFVEKATKKNIPINQMLDEIGLMLVPSLNTEIRITKKHEPKLYALMRDRGVMLTLFFVRDSAIGIEAYSKAFRMVNEKVVTSAATTCPDMGAGCLILSNQDFMLPYLNAHPEVFALDAISAVDRLMDVAIQSDPTHIGKPISVLMISPGDTRWLRQNDCQNVRASSNMTESDKNQPKK